MTAPPETGESIIWHPSKALMKGHWELSLSMDFNTSGSNYAKIHLSSDSLANGYYVKVGGVDDEVSLYKLTSGQSTKIIDGTDDFLDFYEPSIDFESGIYGMVELSLSYEL